METIDQADDDTGLLASQVTELYRNATLASLTMLAIATVMAGILWTVATPAVIAGWYGSIVAITLARIAVTIQYRRAADPAARLKLWLGLHSAGVFLSGLSWGAVLLFIVPVDASFHLVSALFVICGLVTASAGSLASLKHGFAIFSIPALLPGALKFIVLNQTETVLLGCFLCAFLIFIAMVALRIHKVILYSFRTQFESARLVVLAQEENASLMARFDELEGQLERSTQQLLGMQVALAQKDAEHAAAAEGTDRRLKGERFNYLLDTLHGGAWNYNLRTGEIRFSPQWLALLGYKEDEVYPSMEFWKSLLHPDERNATVDALHAHIRGRLPSYFSAHRLRARAGNWVWVFSRAEPVAWDSFGAVLDMVCVEINIEDPDTYLAGRLSAVNLRASEWLHAEPQFLERLHYALRTTAIEGVRHALCHVEVELTPAASAAAKDVANQLATVLVRECRHAEPVLDLGNNSFAVLLENQGIDKALARAAALRKCLEATSIIVDGERAEVQASFGLTPIFDTHKSVPEIFEDAATACHVASSDAQGGIFVFQRGNVEYDSGAFEQRIFAKIRDILADRRLLLTAASLKPLALAATDPVRLFWLAAALPGLKNYAFAAREGQDSTAAGSLATAFDLCAVEMFQAWAAAQPKSYTDQQSVYVYECRPGSLLDEEFVIRVNQLFANNPPGRHVLCLAIPEAAFGAHDDKLRSLVDLLHPVGVKFALTGFGAGSLSHDYLTHLPVDYLKLHEALVANIDTDTTSALTVRYFNDMGRVLDYRTLADCTGGELQEAALARTGTHYVRTAAGEVLNLTLAAGKAANGPAWALSARDSL